MWVKGLIEKFNLKLLSPQTISADMISLTIKKQNEPCPPPKTKQNSLSIIEAWHSPLLDHVISWYEKEKFLRWEQQKGLHSIRNYWAFPLFIMTSTFSVENRGETSLRLQLNWILSKKVTPRNHYYPQSYSFYPVLTRKFTQTLRKYVPHKVLPLSYLENPSPLMLVHD